MLGLIAFQSTIRNHQSTIPTCYCPVKRKTGVCGGGSPLTGGPALKGAGRSVTSRSGVLLPSVAIVAVVVLMMATEPPSHRLAYTRLPSAEAAANMRKRAEAGVQGKTGAQNAAGATA